MRIGDSDRAIEVIIFSQASQLVPLRSTFCLDGRLSTSTMYQRGIAPSRKMNELQKDRPSELISLSSTILSSRRYDISPDCFALSIRDVI